jgi:Flp pilus assembly protein TadG
MKIEVNLRRLVAGAARRARWVRDEQGGSLVEFAILSPLLFVLVAMAGSFTLAFYNLQQIGNATASAVAIVASQQGVTTDPCNLAMASVQAALPGFTAANLSYSLTVNTTGYPASGSGTTFSSGGSSSYGSNTAFSCPNPDTTSSTFASGEPVTLTVTYSYSWLPIPTFHPFGALTPTTALATTESAMAD